MANVTPFDKLVGSVDIYVAPYGSTVPEVGAAPTTPWVKLGPTDGDQSLAHPQTIDYHYDNSSTAPRKATRSEEGVIASFTVVGLTLENYAQAMGFAANKVETGTGTKTLAFKRGFTVTPFALILRGEAHSPYGNLPAQYVIPKGVFDGEPTPTFSKTDQVGLELEFHALDDDSQADADKLGWLEVETA